MPVSFGLAAGLAKSRACQLLLSEVVTSCLMSWFASHSSQIWPNSQWEENKLLNV